MPEWWCIEWRKRSSALFYWFSEPEEMMNRDRRGHSYCDDRGEILRPSHDEPLRKHLPRMFSLIKNESERFEGDQIPP